MYGCKLNVIANGVKRIVNFNQFDHGIPAMDVGKLNGSKQTCKGRKYTWSDSALALRQFDTAISVKMSLSSE